MPAEVRHVVFAPPDLAQAAALFLAKTGRVQSGEIAVVGARGGDAPRLDLAVSNDTGRQSLTLEQTEVLAAILLYCQDRRIPMLRTAVKLMEAVNGSIVLTLHMDFEPQHGTVYHRIFCVGFAALGHKLRDAA